MLIPTDGDLVVAAHAGDQQAIGELLARHRPMALRVALRMVGQRDVAEEVVQEALLEAYLALASLRQPESFAAWLYGIVLNVCRRRLRARQHEPLSLDAMLGGLSFEARPLAMTVAPMQVDPQEAVERDELYQLVLHAMETLSPKNRTATLLFYYEQMSVQEIATLLGISVTAVKGRLHKARQQLRGQLMMLGVGDVADAKIRSREMMVESTRPETVRVVVADVIYQEPGHYSVVLLDEANRCLLPFWVGPAEGDAIALHMLGQATPRPMTHAFLANILTALHVTLEEVRIEALRDITYYAVVKLRQNSQVFEVDARPSDAVALALQQQTPIFVAVEVMAKAGKVVPPEYDLSVQRKGIQQIAVMMQTRLVENARLMEVAKAAGANTEESEMQHKLLELLFGPVAD